MRKPIFLVAVLALAGLALAQVPPVISKTFQTPFAVPTLASDGVDLTGATGWQVILSAEDGGVFAGGGSALCYYYATTYSSGRPYTDPSQRWMRCRTDFDVTPTALVRDTPSPQFVSGVGSGRIAYFPNALGITRFDGGYLDAGAGVDITIEVRRLRP